jgi:hypothetical protein
VLNVSPSGTNVSTETPICITFNESVQAATVTGTTLIVRVQQGQAIQTTLSNFGGGRFFVVVPNAALPANKTIEVVASNLIRDLDGNGLTVPTGGVIGSFTTEATTDTQKTPRVVASFPPANSKNVPPGTNTVGSGTTAVPGTPTQVVTVFSEPIAPSTILGDLTPPPSLDKVGLTLLQTFDPDGPGPLPAQNTNLIPGTGALLLPFNDNRVWVATPVSPFTPGATVTLAVGPGTKNDDVQPQGVSPAFTASFTIAPLEAPQFVNVDVTPATPSELSNLPAFLNNVPTLPDNSANPTYAGKFTIGVLFGASSLATDTLEIQLHDLVGTGTILFSKKAKQGSGQQNYSDLTILDKNGATKLAQGSVVLAARTRRGTVTSAWTLGPIVALDTKVPEVKSFGPPAEGATILSSSRVSSAYGTASESPFALAFTQIQSPVGNISLPPIPQGLQGHLLSSSGNTFHSLPLVPAPPIATPAAVLTPPDEPKAKATITIGDVAGNTSTPQDVNFVFRGRMGGPTLAAQQALTVIVFDEDTLATVSNAVVLLDTATPSGSSTGQTSKAVTLSTTTGITQATFVAGTDFPALTSELTVTAAAPGYDITTIVAVPSSFLSIPIRKTRGTTNNDPTLSVSVSSAPSNSTVDLAFNARPDLADRFFVTSTLTLGGLPVFNATTIAASRVLYLSAFIRNAGTFTYLNDAFGFPVAPVALSGVSSTTLTFGQSYTQTTDAADDPVSVPLAGGIPANLPGAPFDATTAIIESGLFVPGARTGVSGQIGIGLGRNSSIVGLTTTVSVNFDPKVNSNFFAVDPAQNPPFGTVVPFPVDPNTSPTDARFEVRAEDASGRVARTMARSATTAGPIAAVTLPDVPAVTSPTSAGGGTDSPLVRWTDTLAGSGTDALYVVRLRMKQANPVREWRIFLRRASGDFSVAGQLGIQVPSLAIITGAAGSPILTAGSLADQLVDALRVPGLSFNDFFFEDLRTLGSDPSLEQDATFARSQKVEIIY